METVPTTRAHAPGNAIDAIAGIEQRRQAMEKESGLAASCSSALHQLHELLEREKQASLLPGHGAGNSEGAESVKAEIERVKGLTVVTGQGPAKNTYLDPRKVSWRNARNSPAKNKGRHTMGRAGGR